jgi:hypothetical protein
MVYLSQQPVVDNFHLALSISFVRRARIRLGLHDGKVMAFASWL